MHWLINIAAAGGGSTRLIVFPLHPCLEQSSDNQKEEEEKKKKKNLPEKYIFAFFFLDRQRERALNLVLKQSTERRRVGVTFWSSGDLLHNTRS